MTKGNPDWEKFEHEVQDLLDLRSTPGSGNQWYDVGDGRSNPGDPYPLLVDCKHTQRSSYSISGSVLNDWWNKATGAGYHFVLPVRLDGSNVGRQKDWMVVPIHDYVELVDTIRDLNRVKRCGARLRTESKFPCCRRWGHFGHHDNGEAEWA